MNNSNDCDDCGYKCKYYKMYWSLQNKIKDSESQNSNKYLLERIFTLEKQLQEKRNKKIDLTNPKYLNSLEINN